MEPMVLGFSGHVPQARDVIVPGASTTTDAEGSTNVASASIEGTGGINLGKAAPLGSMLSIYSLAQVYCIAGANL